MDNVQQAVHRWLATADTRVQAVGSPILSSFRALDERLGRLSDPPLLFVEYGAGLAPAYFATLFEETAELARVCPCIDAGHVGIFNCRNSSAERSNGEDVCGLRLDTAELPERIAAVQDAVRETLPATVGLVSRLTGSVSRCFSISTTATPCPP